MMRAPAALIVWAAYVEVVVSFSTIQRIPSPRYTLFKASTIEPPGVYKEELSIVDDVTAACVDLKPLEVEGMFNAMVNNKEFRQNYFQKKPFLIRTDLPNLSKAFTLGDVKDAVENDFLEAGRGTFAEGKTGWNMAEVSKPKGTSFEDAKLHFRDVSDALEKQSGTVVFNSAGGFIPRLGDVCLQTVNAFQLPVAINMYITNRGQSTSAPPHTDKQDVFVLQTQGHKRWRVFAPPAPSLRPKADPFARGKGMDILSITDLEEPLIDTVLAPGQLLYVPVGFPHTTDTLEENIPPGSEASVHLTIGIDTLIWGLSYASLRSVVLARSGIPDTLTLEKLPAEQYWSFQESLPLGFLAEPIISAHMGDMKAMKAAIFTTIKQSLTARMRSAESDRWPAAGGEGGGISDAQMEKMLHMDECITRLLCHHMDVTDAFGRMYTDVSKKITPATMDLSFFRSQPYFQELEKIMDEFTKWAANTRASEVSAAGIAGKSTKAASTSSTLAGPSSSSVAMMGDAAARRDRRNKNKTSNSKEGDKSRGKGGFGR